MNVVILCNDFPPLNSIGAERPYSWYKFFVEQGIQTTIITKNWKGSISDAAYDLNQVEPKIDVVIEGTGTIIKVPHKRILPERILMKHGSQKLRLYRKLLTLIYKILSFHFVSFDQHIHIYKEAKKYISNNKVDVLITTAEPFVLFKYGYKLKKKFSIKWIADYRDGWYLNHVTSISSNPLVKAYRLNEYIQEKKYIKTVDLITTVDPILAKNLSSLFSKKASVIYNGFWKFYDSISVKEGGKLKLTHTGTLTVGQRAEFLLDSVLELINTKKILKDDIEIVFVGIEFFNDQLQRLQSHKLYTTGVIKTTKRLPTNLALEYNLSSDFLINFTEKSSQAIYAKTYNYIACKKEILVLPDDNSILGNLVKDNILGHAFSKSIDLQEFLVEKIEKKKQSELDTSLKQNENVIKFTRENQAKELALLLDSI